MSHAVVVPGSGLCLESAVARRAQMLSDQDRHVAEAEGVVRQAVIDMALELGPDLTAGVLGLDAAEVRRLAKLGHRLTSSP